MIGLDLLLHLRLDLLEILGRNAVRQLDIVIEAVLDRRAGGELRFRPDFREWPWPAHARRSGAGVRCRSSARVVREFCVLLASKAGEINHEVHEGHEEFVLSARSAGRGCSGERGLLSPQSSAACRAQNPVGSRRCNAWVAHASHASAMTSRHRGLLRKDRFGDTLETSTRDACATRKDRRERRTRSSAFFHDHAAYDG